MRAPARSVLEAALTCDNCVDKALADGALTLVNEVPPVSAPQ